MTAAAAPPRWYLE